MRDSRINIWTNPTTMNTNTSSTGPTIDLFEYGVTGDYKEGTSLSGVPVEIIVTKASGADADGFSVRFKWQVAEDVSGAPGTWYDHVDIGQVAWNGAASVPGFAKNGKVDGTVAYGLTRMKLSSSLVTAGRRYARLVATTTDIADNTAVVSITALLSDGAHPYMDSLVNY